MATFTMTDKWRKSHPWRVKLLRTVELITEDGFKIEHRPGERMAHTKGELEGFASLVRAEHGQDAISDIYRVS